MICPASIWFPFHSCSCYFTCPDQLFLVSTATFCSHHHREGIELKAQTENGRSLAGVKCKRTIHLQGLNSGIWQDLMNVISLMSTLANLKNIVSLQVDDPSMPNDEGITALHNAVCAGHMEIVKFLVQFGVNANAADSDGW